MNKNKITIKKHKTMASMKKVAALGAAFLGTFILGAGAGIYGEKKYQVSSKFTKKEEATPSAEVVMAQQTSQPANNNKPVMNNGNGNSNHPQQQK